jgi:hypothetical protein
MKLAYSDRQHAYRIDGVRYKSITTVAGVLEDTYNLQLWGKRMVALGMALDPSLKERAIAHHDDRGALNEVAEDALRAAKAHEAAARGTAVHRTLERHDLGEDLIDTPENKALRAAYDKAIEGAGLSVVPEFIERIVCFPKYKVAGRFDRLMKRHRDGKYVVADVKTGESAVKYPHKTSFQLALYANAELMAGPIPNGGGETEEFAPLPEKLDRKTAYIIHAPTMDTVEVVRIDIAQAWKLAQQAIFPALDYRKRTDLITTIGTTSVAELLEPASDERVGWIRGRLADLTTLESGDRAKTYVAARWPAGVPTPKSGVPWTDADVDLIDVMLASVEKECVAGFPVRDPAFAEMGPA